MRTQSADLRGKTSEILEALDRGEEVTITQRGRGGGAVPPVGPVGRRPGAASGQAGPRATKGRATASDVKPRKRDLSRRHFDDS